MQTRDSSRSLPERLRTLLEIKPGEEKLTCLALGATFFHGVSNIYLNSASHALFLASFQAKDLAYTYIGGSITVLLVGAAYAALQHRMALPRLVNGTLAALLVTLLGARIWLNFGAQEGPAAFLAVWSVAFSTLTYMSIWGLFGQIFDARQAKRLFGLIGAGEFAADIVAGFITPWMVELVGSLNLLYVAGAGLFMSIVFTALIAAAARERSAKTAPASAEPPPSRFLDMLKEAYPRSLHLLWGLSLMAFYLLDTAFSSAVESHYKDALDPMTSFMGVFFAVGSAVNMFVETFLSGRFLDRIGIIKALFILPAGVFLFSLSIVGGGFFLPQAGMTMFGLAVCCKMYDYVVRNAVHDPAFQVLYQPLPLAKRFAVQSSVLTRAEPLAALFGGLILILGRFSFEVNLVSATLLMLVTEAALLGFTLPLGRLYLDALKEALKTRRFGAAEAELKDENGVRFALGFLESQQPGEALYALRLLERSAPQRLAQRLDALVRHPAPEIAIEALALAERLRYAELLPDIQELIASPETPAAIRKAAVLACAGIRETEAADELALWLQSPDPTLSQAAMIGLLKHCGMEGVLISGERLLRLLRSENPACRSTAAGVLAEAAAPAFFRTLRPLLADASAEVSRAALLAAEKSPNPRLLPQLLPHLARPRTRRLACKAIAAAGDACLPGLGEALADPHFPRESALGALSAAAMIPGPEAQAFLVEHLYYPLVEARTRILSRLRRVDYNPYGDEQKLLLRKLLEQEAEHGARFFRLGLAASRCERVEPRFTLLAEALRREYEACIDRLFALASFESQGHGVQDAQRALRGGKEKHAYALEMLDALIPEEYKRMLFPFLEDASEEHRLELLNKLFPQPTTPQTPDELLAAALELERAWARPWTRAIALYILGLLGERLSARLAAAVEQATRSEELLTAETARWALARTAARETSPSSLGRASRETGMLIVEKALYLKTLDLFSGLSEGSLADVAQAAEELEVEAGELVCEKGAPCSALYVLVTGKARIADEDKEIAVLGERQAFGLRCALDPHERATSVQALEHCLLLKIEHETLMELVTEDMAMASWIIRSLSRLLGGVEDAIFRERSQGDA
jgi:HEAT repeat protein